MIPAMPISKTHSTLFTFQHSTSSLKLSGSPCPNLNKLTEANRTVPRSPQTSDVWLTCGRTDQLSSWDYLTHTPQATTPKMLLSRLEKAHAKFHSERSQKNNSNTLFGHVLAHSFSRPLKDDLDEQHKLHIKQKSRLLTLSPERIHEITSDIEDLGVSHGTAKRVLIANGYDYDKAVTQPVNHVLKTLEFKERQRTSLAIARLIDPGDTLLDMDCVLEAMLRSPKHPWKPLASIIEVALREREAMIALKRKKLEMMREEDSLEDLNGGAFDMEQD